MTKLWGSRFDGKSDKLADQFSFSIRYDYRLAKYDVQSSIAHAQMLGRQKIITKKDAGQLVSGLKKLLRSIESGQFTFDPKAEDIHTDIQAQLKKLIGEAADKLHTARSRNDLIVMDMKLYCKDELTDIDEGLQALQKSILKFANQNKETIIPAYTHLQAAQVVLLAHHMLAYIEMLERDRQRIQDALKRIDIMPLGSCALSGTSLPTDRDFITKELGFAQTAQNSIDAVSDRDFIIETLSSLAILSMHFSRFSEDLILWASREFNFIDIDPSLCTGSSIMPHKKNPDMLELIRGESGKMFSNLNELLILMKGLPLTYNRDLQLDKPPLFESVEKAKEMTGILIKLFNTLNIKQGHIEKLIQDEAFFSVDIMEYLIKKGVSYRNAHDIVGRMIKDCVDKGKKLSHLNAAKLKQYSSKFEEDIKGFLNPKVSVTIKQSVGSTNPKLVHKQIELWKKKLN
ncbi:MAG: argininosuccinate lyase [Candidatus Omnitrophica bacterium]|nr:argininosuccinate lyase [Candidatus Omnitrophota bacterium]